MSIHDKQVCLIFPALSKLTTMMVLWVGLNWLELVSEMAAFLLWVNATNRARQIKKREEKKTCSIREPWIWTARRGVENMELWWDFPGYCLTICTQFSLVSKQQVREGSRKQQNWKYALRKCTWERKHLSSVARNWEQGAKKHLLCPRYCGLASLYEYTGLHQRVCPQLKCSSSYISSGKVMLVLEHTAVYLLCGANGRLKLHWRAACQTTCK